ncbi:MAG: hypothetical protein V2I27_05725 [Erythrobacter sp.]|jgi:hypothetical protein|nr:hypothetical protein [Erythrobacter sp.]
MRHAALLAGLVLFSACKPPPTDAGLDRELPAPEPAYAPEPLPSPETQGAVWAASESAERRIVYGIPGQSALMAMDCLEESRVRITRLSPADEGAGVMLALVGNGAIGRIPLDAREHGTRFVWKGEIAADAFELEPFAGPRQITATVPGAGMITLNPSPIPQEFLEACRPPSGGSEEPARPASPE